MPNNILQNLTNNVIFAKGERDHLRKLAKKITKTPSKIIIPIEYFTNLGDKS